MFAKVPTAPDTLPTLMTSRARVMRSRARCISSYQRAILRPNVTGSACTPCERPIMTVFLCCNAFFLRVLRTRRISSIIISDDLSHERCKRGIEDVRGREPEMDVAGIRADLLADRGKKGDDVVFHDLFKGIDPLDLEVRFFLDGRERPCRYQPQFGVRLAGKDLNLEPGAVSVLRFPETGSSPVCCSEGSSGSPV